MSDPLKDMIDTLAEVIQNANVVEFPYDVRLLKRFNEILFKAGFDPTEFELPYITATNRNVNSVKESGITFFYYKYKKNPNYVFMFSPYLHINATTGNKYPPKSIAYSYYPVVGGGKRRIKIESPTEDKTAIDKLFDTFFGWLIALRMDENKFEDYLKSFQKPPNNINLNEQKPFSDKEISVLESTINNTLNNARDRIQYLPENERREVEKVLPQTEQLLKKSIEDAKDKNSTKVQWYNKWAKKIANKVGEILAKTAAEHIAKWIVKNVFLPITLTFIINKPTYDLPNLLDPTYIDSAITIERVISALEV